MIVRLFQRLSYLNFLLSRIFFKIHHDRSSLPASLVFEKISGFSTSSEDSAASRAEPRSAQRDARIAFPPTRHSEHDHDVVPNSSLQIRDFILL